MVALQPFGAYKGLQNHDCWGACIGHRGTWTVWLYVRPTHMQCSSSGGLMRSFCSPRMSKHMEAHGGSHIEVSSLTRGPSPLPC